VRQAHELDELEKRLRCILEANGAATSQRRDLETRERVDRHRIRADARDVAVDDDRRALGQHCADAIAEPWKICATDRAADGEGDLVRPQSGHRSLDGRNSQN
jgi:hypothetical protein